MTAVSVCWASFTFGQFHLDANSSWRRAKYRLITLWKAPCTPALQQIKMRVARTRVSVATVFVFPMIHRPAPVGRLVRFRDGWASVRWRPRRAGVADLASLLRRLRTEGSLSRWCYATGHPDAVWPKTPDNCRLLRLTEGADDLCCMICAIFGQFGRRKCA